jgi:RNA exonuclease 4
MEGQGWRGACFLAWNNRALSLIFLPQIQGLKAPTANQQQGNNAIARLLEMAPELSSNWKKLQAQLKAESTASKERKRRAVPTERQQNTIAKRRRLDPSSYTPATSTKKKNKMGIWASAPVVEELEQAPSASLALWAEDNDISAKDLKEAYGGSLHDTSIQGAKPDVINSGLIPDVEIGKYVGIDCEMVGVGGVEDRSVLARVSLVNFHGQQIYDSFVKPKEFVTDWRTQFSGVSPKNMATARSFTEVQVAVANIIKDRILVGHAIQNDLEVLLLSHPKRDIRDTQRHGGFKKFGRYPKLRTLAKEVLGVDIQGGEHSSIEDARATMLLFRRHKSAFDTEHAVRFPSFAPGAASKDKKAKKKKKGKKG